MKPFEKKVKTQAYKGVGHLQPHPNHFTSKLKAHAHLILYEIVVDILFQVRKKKMKELNTTNS